VVPDEHNLAVLRESLEFVGRGHSAFSFNDAASAIA